MKHTGVPFRANAKDDLHCYQACIGMVIEYFSGVRLTWKQLEEVTEMRKDKWTWSTASLLTLHEAGFEWVEQSLFDMQEFIKRGKAYLVELMGKEVGEAQAKHSDLAAEKRRMKQYLKIGGYEKKLPTLGTIRRAIDAGCLVICTVNGRMFHGVDGYSGHAVLIYGYDKKHLWIHDPGLPPREAMKVPLKRFQKVWEYPDRSARNILAIRKIPASGA